MEILKKIDFYIAKYRSKFFFYLGNKIKDQIYKSQKHAWKYPELCKQVTNEFINYIADPQCDEWWQQNKWYGNDIFLTNKALDIHRKLVDEEKVDTNSKYYWDELDRRLYKLYKKRLKKYFSMNN